MRTSGTAGLAAANCLLAEPHLGVILGFERARTLQLGPGEDEETSQIVLVHFLDRVEKITVESHQATDNGANSLVTVRRSVRVQP